MYYFSRKVKHVLLLGLASLSIAACSTDTYVSQENMEKFTDKKVSKFLIGQCMLPQREVQFAVAEHFDFDKHELKQEDYAALDLFIRDIRKLKGRISIVAHTDYQGSNEYNEQLSLRRANSVKEYMELRLADEQYDWELKHYGEEKPIMKAKTLKANAANRRAFVMFEQTIDPDIDPCDPPKPERRVFVASTSHFDFDDDHLKEEDKVELDKIAIRLKGLEGHLLIAGHTDYLGAASYNDKLALRRAEAVKAYLLTKVADTSAFIWEVKSFGENDPLVHEHSLTANKENRRVFVVFKEGDVEEPQKAITPM